MLKQTFAVILMDVQMPKMDGYETARLIRLRDASANTPIIFVTSHAHDETQVSDAYASGAVDFIFAPIVPDILRAKVTIFVDLFLKSRALQESLHDVTLLSDQFRDSEAHTRSVLQNVADGIVTLSAEGVVESCNRAAGELFGYDEDEAVGRPFGAMVARKGAGREERVGTGMLDHTQAGRSQEWIGYRKDGSKFSMELDLSDVQLGSRISYIACLRDISERERYTETLHHQALHDSLTGLPNRVLFSDRVDNAIRMSVRTHEPLAVLVMDLDGFKLVNDSLGHQVGDELLKLVADRLRLCLRDGDTVARLGGDEFGVLLLGGGKLPGVASVVWKIQAALEPPVRDRRPHDRRARQHRHHAGARARRQHQRPAPPRRPRDVRREAARDGVCALLDRAGGRACAPARAARRPAPLHRAQRARPALPAEDRPRDRAGRSAWRR